MRKFAIAAVAVLAIAGSTAVYAQHRHWGHGFSRMSPEDRSAYADARIAAVHAGLKLTADQEKLWPPVEAAVREFAKLRIDRANARMNAPRDDSSQQKPDDPVARLRDRAENMAATAAAMKKIAEAADPLYKTLDDGQKRRLAVLTRCGSGAGKAGAITGSSAKWAGTATLTAIAATAETAMTGMADRTGAVPSGSDAPAIGAWSEHRRKPLKSSGFSPFRRSAKARENSLRLAGHPGVALLNDALLRRLFRTQASGRIAQLVEQMTLNHRVPGSSPGAPTKPFKSLAV